MTQPTQPPERRATFADLRAGMVARIPRPKAGLTGPGPDDADLAGRPLVTVLTDPAPCPTCEALIVQVREADGRARRRHLFPARPVLILQDPA